MSRNENNKCGCEKSAPENVMVIRWQRLVSEGETCPRCGATEHELNKASSILDKSLAQLGIKVVLEKNSLSAVEFEKNPLRSNQIWINNRPLEDYIHGKVGQSPCCDVCGPAECRTLEIDGQIFDTIPSAIIVRAGLIAASLMVAPAPIEPCCGDRQ